MTWLFWLVIGAVGLTVIGVLVFVLYNMEIDIITATKPNRRDNEE